MSLPAPPLLPALRIARARDAGALAELAERTFRATFAAMNTARDMDLHCRRSYGEAIQAQEIASPDRVTWLADEGGALAGYAQLRRGTPPACVPGRGAIEIQRLYVDEAWQGRGLAQALMTACLDEAARLGGDTVWLGVWERNPRAIAFYRKFGFAEAGEHVFPLGDDPQRDVILARPVGP